MADMTFNFSLDIGQTLDIQGIVNKQVFPLLNQAVRAIAKQTAINWQKNVYAAKLWSGEKDAYAQSITWEMTGDFSAVVRSAYKYDLEIENGRPSRDLKKMLGTSIKVRRTEDGRRFLVIPIRHNAQKLEAAGIYGLAGDLTASTILDQVDRPSGQVTVLSAKSGMAPAAASKQSPYLSSVKTKQAQMVRKNVYGWGGSLTKSAMRGAGIPAEVRGWAAGMKRFDTSTGGAKSSSFMTFRIMMEGSGGWIVPAQPGQFIAKQTADAIKGKAEQAMAEAIKRTFES